MSDSIHALSDAPLETISKRRLPHEAPFLNLDLSIRNGIVSSELYYKRDEPRHEISNNVVCATSKATDQPAHTRSLIRAFACRLNIQ